MAISPAEKKIEKFLNTHLRISADYDRLCGVETTTGRTHRTLEIGITAGGVNWRA